MSSSAFIPAGRRSRQERIIRDTCFIMLSFCDLNILFTLLRKQNYFTLKNYTIRIEIGQWFIDEYGNFTDKQERAVVNNNGI
jgi:hypothetical protein